jgi:hypothetical protein
MQQETGMIIRIALYVLIAFPLLFVALHTVIRVVRNFHKFPMPEFR